MDNELGAVLFLGVLFTLVGAAVGGIMDSITVIQGAGYGLGVWAVVCLGACGCCIFD